MSTFAPFSLTENIFKETLDFLLVHFVSIFPYLFLDVQAQDNLLANNVTDIRTMAFAIKTNSVER